MTWDRDRGWNYCRYSMVHAWSPPAGTCRYIPHPTGHGPGNPCPRDLGCLLVSTDSAASGSNISNPPQPASSIIDSPLPRRFTMRTFHRLLASHGIPNKAKSTLGNSINRSGWSWLSCAGLQRSNHGVVCSANRRPTSG